jgi:hypothetical protein
MSPITETGHADGKVGMFAELETEDQLLDTAIGAAVDVFTAGNDIGPSSAQSRFVQQLAEMGPRTASALRDLSKTLDRAGFDIEIDWQQPSRTTRRVTVSSTAAAYTAATVENANFDEQPVQIVGEYLTVSAVSSWLIARRRRHRDGQTRPHRHGRSTWPGCRRSSPHRRAHESGNDPRRRCQNHLHRPSRTQP